MMAKTYLTKLVRLLPHRKMIMIQNRIRMQSYNFSVMHFQLDCLIPKMTPFPTYNNIWILPCSFQSLSNLFSFLIFHGNLLNVVTIWPHLSYDLSLLHILHFLHITRLKMDVDIMEEDKIRIITHLLDYGI